MPKKQQSIEELEKEEEDIVFREKEELVPFLKLSYMDGLEMDQLVLTILSYTGLRICEILALKWGDLNEKQGTIRVTKTLYNPKKISAFNTKDKGLCPYYKD